MSEMELPRSIPHVVLRAAQLHGDKPAIVDGARRISYRQLRQLMLQAAAAFRALGLQKGDRVAVWAPNQAETIVAALGAQAAGGCIVPLNTRFKGGEVQYILNQSRARILVMTEVFLGHSYPQMLEGVDLPHLEHRVLLPSEAGDGDWDRLLEDAQAGSAAAAAALEGLTGEELSDIMFTSGTTGNPKGVMTTHRQNVAVYRAWSDSVGLREDDRFAIIYPFFHCAGYKAGWLATFICGATIYPVAQLEVKPLCELVAAEKISFLPGPPTLFQTLLSTPPADRAGLRSLRASVTGASMVPPSMIERMRSELDIATVITGYGLTEACGTVTMTSAGDPAELIVRSCGKAIPGVELRCVDERNREVPVGEAGEVVVRGYNVMLGYFEDPDNTAKAIDAQGWLHTNDIGVLDENGYLRITDRKNDMFIVGGFNCYPAEIERIMCGNPDYMHVAVVGVPDDRLGEVGKAYVVPRSGAVVTPQSVIAWCRDAMANYKVPRYVEVVDTLPTNAMGKVQKFRLRDDAGSQSSGGEPEK
ncbi:fatty acid--CoA ligase [Steroidobacter denitrificans]|uniref:Fatty acid--CoA ligase n=1 Tax=Steroidobacter denitrificans TaxID=465721 RepID=A0A127F709_STEDE|nr:FadD3 family acyl-CoA ligase [Steroidobacter denitrificans]AMN46233.1 fatty acid--CoA ligase [Steroidobacter denitrificans]